METGIPSKLYKFQPLRDYSLDNLRWARIWFSKPEKLNDPFDSMIPYNFSCTAKEYKEIYDGLVKQQIEKGRLDTLEQDRLKFITRGRPNQAFKDVIHKEHLSGMQRTIDGNKQMGIACFTQTLDNILMWSHYADAHKGFCLEFDTSYFPFSGIEEVHPVIYRNSYPLYSPVSIIRGEPMRIDILKTKSKVWKYEKEWRLIRLEGDSPLEYDPKALTAIYFGCSMLDDQKKLVAELPAKSAAQLYQMKKSNTKFQLEPEPYHR